MAVLTAEADSLRAQLRQAGAQANRSSVAIDNNANTRVAEMRTQLREISDELMKVFCFS